MIQMRPALSIFLFSITLMCGFACTPDDSERCGDDFVFNGHSCDPVDNEDTDTATDTDVDTGVDTNVDTGDTEGNGQTCSAGGPESADCPTTADYCLKQPGADTGYCGRSGCATSPDDCPDGYACCAMSSGDVFCAKDADQEFMAGLGLCGGN